METGRIEELKNLRKIVELEPTTGRASNRMWSTSNRAERRSADSGSGQTALRTSATGIFRERSATSFLAPFPMQDGRSRASSVIPKRSSAV